MKAKKTHMLSLLTVSLFIFLAFGSSEDDNTKNADGTSKTEREIKLDKQFSAWDGSHLKLTELIKGAMNDPDSYEHVKTVYWDMKDHIIVRTIYSGKNAFGGRVRNWVRAKIDDNGNIIEIMDEGSGN
jgi:hypothetical protein